VNAPRAPRRRAALAASALAALAGVVAAGAAPAPRPARPARPAAPDGAQLYASICASCHQPSGEGSGPAFPPLAGAGWVTGDERRLVLVVLHGLVGEIDVDGRSYAGAMPPWGSALSDEEVAAVATYVRGSWGNKASAVSAATVARLRAAHRGRAAPWTASELAEVAAGG
jgi:mono/diheme cytochrome c family protein